jgi:hypothetical protein
VSGGITFSLEKKFKRALVNYFTRRKGRRSRLKPPYGISVSNVAPEQSSVAITLTLRAGERYCCGTALCGFYPPRFGELRFWLAAEGIEMGYPIRIHYRENCERGALIATDPSDLSTCKPVDSGASGEERIIDESEIEGPPP